jgi:hypothetical protein
MPLSSVAPVDPLRSTSGLWPERVIVTAGSAVTGATDPRGTGRAAIRAARAGRALAGWALEAWALEAWALAVDVLRAESPGEVSAEARGASAAIAAPMPSATASAPR